MWGSSKDKEIIEKTKQIQILNDIIKMNSKQTLSQNILIQELKQVKMQEFRIPLTLKQRISREKSNLRIVFCRKTLNYKKVLTIFH